MSTVALVPRSNLAARSPINSVKGGMIFVALRSYFDGSKSGKFLTLAGIAASDSVWQQIESSWLAVSHTGPSSLHMCDAMSLHVDYSALSEPFRDSLIYEYIKACEKFRNSEDLYAVTCTVDLEAHKLISKQRTLPSPQRLCARLVVDRLMNWYISKPGPIDMVDIFFDRNEAFMRHIYADWKSPAIRKRYWFWQNIRTISPAVSSSTPGLQVSDMMAWGRNYLNGGERKHVSISSRAANIIRGLHLDINGHLLSTGTFREEGFEAINQQQLRQIKERFEKQAMIKI